MKAMKVCIQYNVEGIRDHSPGVCANYKYFDVELLYNADSEDKDVSDEFIDGVKFALTGNAVQEPPDGAAENRTSDNALPR